MTIRTSKYPPNVRRLISQIRDDNANGAIAISRILAHAFHALSEDPELQSLSLSHVKASAAEMGKDAIQSQPLMGPVFNLVNDALWEIEEVADVLKVRERLQMICNRFMDTMNSSIQAVAEISASMIKNDTTIATISYSSTVRKAFVEAKSSGKNFKVFCTESRPVGEGVELANVLAGEGIPVALMVDAAIYSMLSKIDMILVGADAIMESGVVNKIGTLGLCMTAHSSKIESYALCSSEKIVPLDYHPHIQIKKEAKEISKAVSPNVEVMNYYFDLTPFRYFSGIVSEKGILQENDLKTIQATKKIHPALQNLDLPSL